MCTRKGVMESRLLLFTSAFLISTLLPLTPSFFCCIYFQLHPAARPLVDERRVRRAGTAAETLQGLSALVPLFWPACSCIRQFLFIYLLILLACGCCRGRLSRSVHEKTERTKIGIFVVRFATALHEGPRTSQFKGLFVDRVCCGFWVLRSPAQSVPNVTAKKSLK